MDQDTRVAGDQMVVGEEEHTHPGEVPFPLEDDGGPSRVNTLRALRVLRWAGDDVEL